MNRISIFSLRRAVRSLVMPCLAIASILLAPAPARADEAARKAAAELFWWGDFDKLETLYARVSSSSVRDERGRREVDDFRTGLGRVFRGSGDDGIAYYTELVRLTRAYADAHPQSTLAHAMVARALYGRAWRYRGSGFAREVPAQGMAAFKTDIEAAERYVADHSVLMLTDTTTHVYLLMIGRSADWSRNRHWALVEDALRRDPEQLDVYQEIMTTMLPKWGGDADAMEAVANSAVKRTQASWGSAMYASVYMTALFDLEGDFFRQTRVKWNTLRQSFDDLIARYPDPVNLNNYARAACLAEDKPTTLKLIEQIGESPVADSWGGKDFRQFDTCRSWARQK